MSQPIIETRKYIVGWLNFPPGNREKFMALASAYAEACRAEPGCLFFEMNPSTSDPDVITIAECFASEAAHATHLSAENFQKFWPILRTLAKSGRFENIYAGRVVADEVDFLPA